MEPRISLITLGVKDLAKSVEFYKKLGWPPSKHSVEGQVAFFELDGTWLGLWPEKEMAKETGRPAKGRGSGGITLSHNVKSEKDVDALFAQLRKMGAIIVKAPQTMDWGGYSGYFQDSDGHLWEVAYNPHFWPGPK
jgi:hypothetical protein